MRQQVRGASSIMGSRNVLSCLRRRHRSDSDWCDWCGDAAMMTVGARSMACTRRCASSNFAARHHIGASPSLSSAAGGRDSTLRQSTTAPNQVPTTSEELLEHERGVFQDAHLKAFPVRAAFDIGSGGYVSLAVGRVDAQHRAVQDLLLHQRVPVSLEYEHSLGGSNVKRISQRTITSIRSNLRLLTGVLKRDVLRGASDVAGMITFPLCECENVMELRDALEKDFRIRLSVLGEPRGSTSLKQRTKQPQPQTGVSGNYSTQSSPAALMDQLGFSASAAASSCVARHRMLSIEESERHGSISICGWAHEDVIRPHIAGDRCADQPMTVATAAVRLGDMEEHEFLRLAGATSASSMPLARHVLPITTNDVQRMLLVNAQRRQLPADMSEADQVKCSPNPVQRKEWSTVVSLCSRMISATLPAWVQEKSAAGGMICGASNNGGLLNIVARVSQQQHSSLEHLEANAEHQYCGMTDVLLSAYPEPERVLSSAALGSALMRALETPRIRYLPDVSVAHALLVSEDLWAYDAKAKIRAELATQAWYSQPHLRRSLSPPPNRDFRGQPA